MGRSRFRVQGFGFRASTNPAALEGTKDPSLRV